MLQLNPVNGLSEVVAAQSAVEAEERRANLPRTINHRDPQVMFVTEQQRLASEAGAEAHFEGINGRASGCS